MRKSIGQEISSGAFDLFDAVAIYGHLASWMQVEIERKHGVLKQEVEFKEFGTRQEKTSHSPLFADKRSTCHSLFWPWLLKHPARSHLIPVLFITACVE
jgi:hypothetical protein